MRVQTLSGSQSHGFRGASIRLGIFRGPRECRIRQCGAIRIGGGYRKRDCFIPTITHINVRITEVRVVGRADRANDGGKIGGIGADFDVFGGFGAIDTVGADDAKDIRTRCQRVARNVTSMARSEQLGSRNQLTCESESVPPSSLGSLLEAKSEMI